MDDNVRAANTGEMDDPDTVDNASEIDDNIAVAHADAVDDDGKINDVCVKYTSSNWEGSNKPENTDFSVKTWKEDLTLLVENKKLYVSKAVLGLVSPVFDRMIQSEFKEGHQTEIELPDKKLDDVKEFLRCIYPNMENDVSEKKFYTILSLADEYQVTSLKTKCEDLLMKFLEKNSPICEVYKVLNVASRYHITKLMEEGLELASRRSLEDLECAEKRSSNFPRNQMYYSQKDYGKSSTRG
ncbi:BTB and MATH domain-containing protein 38-like [Mercenaria mercenaria]|uniref:BTB and MATH domain-containing protein 38-like n=1 Tax=Mercenaria mercenaria TaxID=6596 RepID=UPI00234EEFCB|nr:BTB and MATH domain-containing protein 38-like [Mercenaria mercenaria]